MIPTKMAISATQLTLFFAIFLDSTGQIFSQIPQALFTELIGLALLFSLTLDVRAHAGPFLVFLGRFVALLRMLAAFLAGVNRMPWRAFLVANACGGIIWAAVFGIGGYFFGKLLLQLHHALAPIVFGLALAAFFGCGYLVRRYEDRLTASAERALPGPLVAAVDEKRL